MDCLGYEAVEILGDATSIHLSLHFTCCPPPQLKPSFNFRAKTKF